MPAKRYPWAKTVASRVRRVSRGRKPGRPAFAKATAGRPAPATPGRFLAGLNRTRTARARLLETAWCSRGAPPREEGGKRGLRSDPPTWRELAPVQPNQPAAAGATRPSYIEPFLSYRGEALGAVARLH